MFNAHAPPREETAPYGEQCGPPVSRLNDDILFNIFTINSHMNPVPFNDSGASISFDIDSAPLNESLISNRYSSQVCHRWRAIVLSSPTIWANALDIYELCQKNDAWREEVFRRTGNALISLSGTICVDNHPESKYAIPLVLTILKDHWSRIRYLGIDMIDETVLEALRVAVEQPAPNLEHFGVSTGEAFTQDGTELPCNRKNRQRIMFSNDNPRLQFLCCEGFGYVPSGAWLSNIRQFWLMGSQASLTVQEIYDAIRTMPLLEELMIDKNQLGQTAPRLSQSLPMISLPRLSNIAIALCKIDLVTDLIKYITPAPGCRLTVGQGSLEREMTDLDVSKLGEVYSNFITTTSNFEDVTFLELQCLSASEFAIEVAYGPVIPHPYRDQWASSIISIQYHSDGDWESSPMLNLLANPILKALASCRMKKLAILRLSLDEETGINNQTSELLLALFMRLDTVNEIECTDHELEFLSSAQPNVDTPIFPALKTVTVFREDEQKVAVSRFIVGRLKIGAPLQFLNLSRHASLTEDEGAEEPSLDKIDGVSFVYIDSDDNRYSKIELRYSQT